MKLDAALSKLGDTAQIRSSSLGDIYSNSNKPTGVFAKIRMAFSAVFRSRATEHSFRSGFYSTRLMIQNEMGTVAAEKFDKEFGNRLRRGAPLTAGNVRSFISREFNQDVVDFKDRVSELNSKIVSLRGDSNGFCDVLTSICEEAQRGEELGFENGQEMNTIIDSLHTLMKNFGLQEDEKTQAGVSTETIEAIYEWGQAQAEFSLAEKRGETLPDDKIDELKNQQSEAYLQFENQLAEVPKQRQAILEAGALIRELSANGQHVPEGFVKTPQLSQKAFEVLQILHEKRPQGDDYFEFS